MNPAASTIRSKVGNYTIDWPVVLVRDVIAHLQRERLQHEHEIDAQAGKAASDALLSQAEAIKDTKAQ